MELQKQNTSSHGGENSNPLSLNLIYAQNPPPISNISWRELITPYSRRKTDHPKTGQLGPQKQNKRAVFTNSEKTENCKRMRKPEDKNTDNFKTWSPRAIWSAKQPRAANEKAPTVASSKRCRIENVAEKQRTLKRPNAQFKRVPLIPQESVKANNSLVVANSHPPSNINSRDEEEVICTGRSDNLNAVDKSFIGTNFDSCTRRTELERQGTFEKPNSQFTPLPSSISSDSVEIVNLDVNNSLPVANSHTPSTLVSLRYEDVEPSQAVSDFKNFRIIVDGTDITSDIKPAGWQISYLLLCRDRNSLLHKGLVEGINLNHAVFVISQTVDISSAIKTSDISTPQKEIIYWSKALESFSTIGMDVGFMLARVNRLLDIKIKETKAMDRKRDEEAKTEEEGLEEKIRALESEIEKMREEKRRIQEEREGIRKKANELETMFRLEASAPW